MNEKLIAYDPAVALVDDEEMAFFMADAVETGDSAYAQRIDWINQRLSNRTLTCSKVGIRLCGGMTLLVAWLLSMRTSWWSWRWG